MRIPAERRRVPQFFVDGSFVCMLFLQHAAMFSAFIMKKPSHVNLSRRERQIMDVLYRRGRATAAEVRKEMPDPPGYSAVRAMLRVLEEKGHIRHEEEA